MHLNTQEFEPNTSKRGVGLEMHSGAYSTRKKKTFAETDNLEMIQPKGTRFKS